MTQPRDYGFDEETGMLKDAAARFFDEKEMVVKLRPHLKGTEDPYRGNERAPWYDEAAWQEISAEDQVLITSALDEMAWQSLAWAQESEEMLIAEIESHGVTFTTVDNGLDLEAFRNAQAEVVRENIGASYELMDDLFALRCLEINLDALLARVGARVGHCLFGGTPSLIQSPVGGVYLDHARAEVRQKGGAVGPGLDCSQVQYGHA